MAPLVRESRFLRALRGEAVDATPVWLMRQAGRYLPEYRALRERHPFGALVGDAELACEVTLQPLRRFELDAAVVFSDILPPLAAVGLSLRFGAGEAPAVENPVRDEADLARLRLSEPEEAVPATLAAIRLARRELSGRGVPLIGFAGAPYTLASYAVEGGPGRDRRATKRLMKGRPDLWNRLLGMLAELSGRWLAAQARAGADALQLFDSWAGDLAPDDYRRHVLPHTRRAIAIASEAGVPVIHFATGTGAWLALFRQAGGDAVGVDWRVDLGEAVARLGEGVVVQGNLDPAALLAEPGAFLPDAQRIVERGLAARGHVFNLGHGVLPETPVEHVARLVAAVHEHSARLRASQGAFAP